MTFPKEEIWLPGAGGQNKEFSLETQRQEGAQNKKAGLLLSHRPCKR